MKVCKKLQELIYLHHEEAQTHASSRSFINQIKLRQFTHWSVLTYSVHVTVDLVFVYSVQLARLNLGALSFHYYFLFPVYTFCPSKKNFQDVVTQKQHILCLKMIQL